MAYCRVWNPNRKTHQKDRAQDRHRMLPFQHTSMCKFNSTLTLGGKGKFLDKEGATMPGMQQYPWNLTTEMERQNC